MLVEGITMEGIAMVCHEAIRAYCRGIGDPAGLPWDEAPEWARVSSRHAVEHALTGQTPEQQHESWAKERTDAGWTYGPYKDIEAKTSPCLVPYAELPDAQRRKDVLILAIVEALA